MGSQMMPLAHEYLCPKCNHVNSLEHEGIRDMYQEQYTLCENCETNLEIVPADGIGDQINLIVSLAITDTVPR